jgi:hypothetical protein
LSLIQCFANSKQHNRSIHTPLTHGSRRSRAFFIIKGTNNIKEAIELYLSIITESPHLKTGEKLGFVPQPNLRLKIGENLGFVPQPNLRLKTGEKLGFALRARDAGLNPTYVYWGFVGIFNK